MPALCPDFASSRALQAIGKLLEARAGQQIAANRVWRVETALTPMLRAHGIVSMDQLVVRLSADRHGPLADAVVDALLNQETSFFRDAGVIEQVVDAARELQKVNPGKRLRIWSAGCSVGQEPYSLAMLFAEAALTHQMEMPEIIATDVSPIALARARAGRYSQFEIQRGLPVRRMVSWFDAQQEDWVARPDLVRRVQFRRHNLAKDPAPGGKFDIVLCRNVMLYFAQAVRAQVFATLRAGMREGGLLVLGAGETAIGQTDMFVPSERFRGFYKAQSGDVVTMSR